MAQVEIISDADDLTVATWLHKRLTQALQVSSGRLAISLPGGATPFPILRELAGLGLDWSRIDVWPGDDRIVAEDHPASNCGRMRAVLEPLGARLMPLAEGAVPPHFVLTWLGMGDDGHVASLFPNADPQPADPQRLRRIVPDPLPPQAPFARLTLTMPALLDSDELLFVIRGAHKRALFQAALRGEHDLPVARLLAAARQPVTCFA